MAKIMTEMCNHCGVGVMAQRHPLDEPQCCLCGRKNIAPPDEEGGDAQDQTPMRGEARIYKATSLFSASSPYVEIRFGFVYQRCYGSRLRRGFAWELLGLLREGETDLIDHKPRDKGRQIWVHRSAPVSQMREAILAAIGRALDVPPSALWNGDKVVREYMRPTVRERPDELTAAD